MNDEINHNLEKIGTTLDDILMEVEAAKTVKELEQMDVFMKDDLDPLEEGIRSIHEGVERTSTTLDEISSGARSASGDLDRIKTRLTILIVLAIIALYHFWPLT